MGCPEAESRRVNGRLAVRIQRGKGERFDEFTVARRDSQTVLDVVTEIQREQDATLAYRFACRVGMCGSCAMTVNGRPRWTCRARVSQAVDGAGRLTLEPLRNLPVIKDLAVDMAPFFEKWRDAHGFFEPGEAPPEDFIVVPPASPERRAADEGIECIDCGVCYSACDVVAWRPIISARRRSTVPGRWSTTCATRGSARRLAAVSGAMAARRATRI